MSTASHRTATDGLAAGAACADPATPPDQLATCPRVPVVYRYTVGADGTGTWSRMSLPDEGPPARPGFVGAIAWIGKDHALAVGGDGCYPRREEPLS